MMMSFLILASEQAADFLEMTKEDENRIEPRRIQGGPHKGRFAIPARVQTDPAYHEHRVAFAMLTAQALDTDEAFPAPPEEEPAEG